MLDQVYSTKANKLFCSVEIMFLRFEGLYKSLSKAFTKIFEVIFSGSLLVSDLLLKSSLLSKTLSRF